MPGFVSGFIFSAMFVLGASEPPPGIMATSNHTTESPQALESENVRLRNQTVIYRHLIKGEEETTDFFKVVGMAATAVLLVGGASACCHKLRHPHDPGALCNAPLLKYVSPLEPLMDIEGDLMAACEEQNASNRFEPQLSVFDFTHEGVPVRCIQVQAPGAYSALPRNRTINAEVAVECLDLERSLTTVRLHVLKFSDLPADAQAVGPHGIQAGPLGPGAAGGWTKTLEFEGLWELVEDNSPHFDTHGVLQVQLRRRQVCTCVLSSGPPLHAPEDDAPAAVQELEPTRVWRCCYCRDICCVMFCV